MVRTNNQNPLSLSLAFKSNTNQRLASDYLFKWEKDQPNKAKTGAEKTEKILKSQ